MKANASKTSRREPSSNMASSDIKIIHDDSVERENDPEDTQMAQAIKASVGTFQQEQIVRDAEMARHMAAEFSTEPADTQPVVVQDGSIEKTL